MGGGFVACEPCPVEVPAMGLFARTTHHIDTPPELLFTSGEPLCTPMPTTNSPAFKSLKIFPAPKPGSWLKTYGSWEGFCKAVDESTGMNRGGGIVTFCRSYLEPTATEGCSSVLNDAPIK